MGYSLNDKLVIAVASSALFDLTESDKVFREQHESEYRYYQRENENVPLGKGVAFSLVKRLLSLNTATEKLVEVILLSRNDPDTGLRVFNTIESYGLDISRAIFTAGKNPFRYIEPLNASLFLSGNIQDVREAIEYNCPAGYVGTNKYYDDEQDSELRIAFDFDGVIANDESETVYQEGGGMQPYHKYEKEHANDTMGAGPLFSFFQQLSELQKKELNKMDLNPDYSPIIRIAICTARNAPAHERAIKTLRKWDIRVDEAFFLGGIKKNTVLDVYRPHIFFDDQISHIADVSQRFPCAHIPYGVVNKDEKVVTKVTLVKE
ncbi:5'-nucleotidase [Listeria booriae]|uniref:5'-nucleotidase n=1 Tax=Listeria booriae TaxID=1552123 RepID=UPI001628D9FB|nr:5'-nucleotidase [Listeria booriae]MBC2258132.1 5'-nucleotidase [Listeria booriae]MBC6129278.1 5'-nucleotidase [Listeria booriae]